MKRKEKQEEHRGNNTNVWEKEWEKLNRELRYWGAMQKLNANIPVVQYYGCYCATIKWLWNIDISTIPFHSILLEYQESHWDTCLSYINHKKTWRKAYMKHIYTNMPSKSDIKITLWLCTLYPEKSLALMFLLMFCKDRHRYFYPIHEEISSFQVQKVGNSVWNVIYLEL